MESAEEHISFGIGHPSADLLPLGPMREVMGRALDGVGAEVLSYGPNPGMPDFRAELAMLLEKECSLRTSSDQIMVTNGNSYLMLAFSALAARKDRVDCGAHRPPSLGACELMFPPTRMQCSSRKKPTSWPGGSSRIWPLRCTPCRATRRAPSRAR